jgi:uncharacterized membrane protein
MSENARPSWLTLPIARIGIAVSMLAFVSLYYGAEWGIIHVVIFLLLDLGFTLIAKRRRDNRILFLGRLFAVVLAFLLPTLLIFALALSSPPDCKGGVDCGTVKIYRAPTE